MGGLLRDTIIISFPGAYLKFQLKGWALIQRRVLNRGGGLLHFPLNELEKGLVVPGEFTAFTNSEAIGQKLKEERMHIKNSAST